MMERIYLPLLVKNVSIFIGRFFACVVKQKPTKSIAVNPTVLVSQKISEVNEINIITQSFVLTINIH